MKPLSNDMRERIIEATENNEGGSRTLAKRFIVGRATVRRVRQRFLTTGSVDPKPHGGGRKRSFSVENDEQLRALVSAHADATLERLVDLMQEQHGLSTNKSTLDRALKRLGLSLKKSHTMRQNETPRRSRSKG